MTVEEMLAAMPVSPAGQAWIDEVNADAQAARLSEKPLVEKLNAYGLQIESIWDLVNLHTDYPHIIPVLTHHLRLDYHPKR